jgi:hypothetical protein
MSKSADSLDKGRESRVAGRRSRVAVAFVCALLSGSLGCTDRVGPHALENVGQIAEALIAPSAQNIPIAFTVNHELSVTYVKGAGGPVGGSARGRWVIAANNFESLASGSYWSWGYSDDANASSWQYEVQTSATQFGCPGGACPGTVSPTDGSYFTGWASDVSLAAVTDPGWSNSDKRVVGVSLASTQNNVQPDIIVALSENGGQSWGNLQWVTTSASGGDADMPFVFSNPQSPYDTYVSWRSITSQNVQRGHLRKIKYGISPATFDTTNPVIDIPKRPEDTLVNRFNFGFATLPSACTSGGEGIFVVYANGGKPRCGGTGAETWGTTYWNLAVYDTAATPPTWYGPWRIVTDDYHDSCVGSPYNKAYTNTVDPHIAVDPVTADVWVTHTRQSSLNAPVRTAVEYGRFQCVGGGGPNIDFSTLFTAPDPCQQAGCGDADNWIPAIAMHRYGGVSRVGVYWYGTTDPANRRVGVWAAYQENLGAMQGPVLLSSSAFPVTSGTTEWAVDGSPGGTYVDPWDYQTLGTSWQNGSFLALWASDPRASKLYAWNGGFETGSFSAYGPAGTDWVPSGSFYTVTGLIRRSGTYSALLGSGVAGLDSSITQTFTAPQWATNLSFHYWMTCPDTVWFDWLTATLKNNTTQNTVTFLPKTCETNANFVPSPTVAVTPGTSYTLTITNHDDAVPADPSYTYIDDVVFSGANQIADMRIMSNLAR